MSQSTLKRAIGAVKDQTSIGLAKVGSSTSLADLEVAIVKATKHNENPAEEKHIREILSLTCYSRAFISACVNNLSKRLSKTSSWTVALKTLVLIQRLLSDGDPAYEQEIFFSTRQGTRLLNMSDFRDTSKSNSWDFSSFVRTYALYLDERIEYKMQHKRGRRSRFAYDEEEEEEGEGVMRSTSLYEMRSELLFSKMQHLQLLLERFLACRPTGRAKSHRIVIVALYPIVKESFQTYHDMTEILGIFIDRFTDMEVPDCIKVYDMFCRVGKQYDELDLFYSWSKSIGIARSSEYPEIERVTTKKLELIDQFIKDKSLIAQTKKLNAQEEKNNETNEEEKGELQEDNEIKALPPPEEFNEEQTGEVKEEQDSKEEKTVQTEGDLLDLRDSMVTKQEYDGNKLALALFDGEAQTTSTTQALPWHAFDDAADWETTLVQSSSNLPNQKPSLGGGFDSLLLDSMYKQSSTNASMQGISGYGSASSFAKRSEAMLALPAPQSSRSSSSLETEDPFAASRVVAPPAYVQMSEIEKKQRLLAEEQAMWQQYARSGSMNGQVSFTTQQQPNNFYMGGFPQNYGNYYH
uniref:Clathrin assembly protein At1g03050 n=1 Tax=Cicer arietinum TaxID=3827 RepID=A0A3Q7Y7P0_CICAR|nr:putative clathrin assembly protein At1g03050 [Cicer arietinum]